MLAIKAWYFFYFAANACLFPFFNLIFRRQAGLTAQQIGLVAALRPWVGLPSGAALSGIADTWRAHRPILLTTLALASLGRCSVSIANSFVSILVIMLLADALMAPVTIMADAAAMAAFDDHGEYGRHRLWGAVGWGSMAFITGTLMQTFTASVPAFVLYGVLSAATFVPTCYLPWQPLHAKLYAIKPSHSSETSTAAEEENVQDVAMAVLEGQPVQQHTFDSLKNEKKCAPTRSEVHFFRGVVTLLSDAEACTFFLQATVMGFAVGTIEGFLFLYLEDLNGTSTLMGLSLTFTCIAETIVFYYSGSIIAKLGLDGCFHLCFGAFLVRLGCYATLTWWPSPWLVLPVELLHGLTFALTWSVGTAKCAVVSPPGLEATTQSLFQGVLFGLGHGVGGLAAGSVYHSHGPQAPFVMAFTVVAAGWIATVWLQTVLRAQKGGPRYKALQTAVVEMNTL